MKEVLGHRVLIKPDPVEKEHELGNGQSLILAVNERQEKAGTSSGTVIDYGPSAWLDPALGGEPWVEKGDRVIYAKYSGKFFTDPDDGEEYVIVNDDAIQVRIEKCQ